MQTGYFENTSDVPTYDPGLDVICPVCHKKLTRPVKTISIMLEDTDKSLFYRTCKSCYDGLSDEGKWELDQLALAPQEAMIGHFNN